jgi:hypothetical protein
MIYNKKQNRYKSLLKDEVLMYRLEDTLNFIANRNRLFVILLFSFYVENIKRK